MSEKVSLKEIAKVFTKLGMIGFGGPATYIAMIKEEVVVQRKGWMNNTS